MQPGRSATSIMSAKNISPKSNRGFVGFLRRYFRALRFYLVTGVLVWIPLIVTVWLTWWLFTKVGLSLERFIANGFGWLNNLGARYDISILQGFRYHPGAGFLVATALFLTTGFFARNLIGRRFISYGEKILNRIPLIRNVYRAVKQIRDVFVRRDGAVFQRVCLVEYPRKGVFAVAFVTSDEQGIVQEAVGKNMLSIFLPTTPNPTSGFLLYISEDETTPLPVSVEDAMKLIISAGAYLPEKLPKVVDAKTVALPNAQQDDR